MSLQTLHEVQNFLTTGNAFEVLHIEFQQWLTTGKRPRRKSEDTYKLINTPPAISLKSRSNVIEDFVSGKNSASAGHLKTWICILDTTVILATFSNRPQAYHLA
jgi:hypothetical protein